MGETALPFEVNVTRNIPQPANLLIMHVKAVSPINRHPAWPAKLEGNILLCIQNCQIQLIQHKIPLI